MSDQSEQQQQQQQQQQQLFSRAKELQQCINAFKTKLFMTPMEEADENTQQELERILKEDQELRGVFDQLATTLSNIGPRVDKRTRDETVHEEINASELQPVAKKQREMIRKVWPVFRSGQWNREGHEALKQFLGAIQLVDMVLSFMEQPEDRRNVLLSSAFWRANHAVAQSNIVHRLQKALDPQTQKMPQYHLSIDQMVRLIRDNLPNILLVSPNEVAHDPRFREFRALVSVQKRSQSSEESVGIDDMNRRDWTMAVYEVVGNALQMIADDTNYGTTSDAFVEVLASVASGNSSVYSLALTRDNLLTNWYERNTNILPVLRNILTRDNTMPIQFVRYLKNTYFEQRFKIVKTVDDNDIIRAKKALDTFITIMRVVYKHVLFHQVPIGVLNTISDDIKDWKMSTIDRIFENHVVRLYDNLYSDVLQLCTFSLWYDDLYTDMLKKHILTREPETVVVVSAEDVARAHSLVPVAGDAATDVDYTTGTVNRYHVRNFIWYKEKIDLVESMVMNRYFAHTTNDRILLDVTRDVIFAGASSRDEESTKRAHEALRAITQIIVNPDGRGRPNDPHIRDSDLLLRRDLVFLFKNAPRQFVSDLFRRNNIPRILAGYYRDDSEIRTTDKMSHHLKDAIRALFARASPEDGLSLMEHELNGTQFKISVVECILRYINFDKRGLQIIYDGFASKYELVMDHLGFSSEGMSGHEKLHNRLRQMIEQADAVASTNDVPDISTDTMNQGSHIGVHTSSTINNNNNNNGSGGGNRGVHKPPQQMTQEARDLRLHRLENKPSHGVTSLAARVPPGVLDILVKRGVQYELHPAANEAQHPGVVVYITSMPHVADGSGRISVNISQVVQLGKDIQHKVKKFTAVQRPDSKDLDSTDAVRVVRAKKQLRMYENWIAYSTQYANKGGRFYAEMNENEAYFQNYYSINGDKLMQWPTVDKQRASEAKRDYHKSLFYAFHAKQTWQNPHSSEGGLYRFVSSSLPNPIHSVDKYTATFTYDFTETLKSQLIQAVKHHIKNIFCCLRVKALHPANASQIRCEADDAFWNTASRSSSSSGNVSNITAHIGTNADGNHDDDNDDDELVRKLTKLVEMKLRETQRSMHMGGSALKIGPASSSQQPKPTQTDQERRRALNRRALQPLYEDESDDDDDDDDSKHSRNSDGRQHQNKIDDDDDDVVDDDSDDSEEEIAPKSHKPVKNTSTWKPLDSQGSSSSSSSSNRGGSSSSSSSGINKSDKMRRTIRATSPFRVVEGPSTEIDGDRRVISTQQSGSGGGGSGTSYNLNRGVISRVVQAIMPTLFQDREAKSIEQRIIDRMVQESKSDTDYKGTHTGMPVPVVPSADLDNNLINAFELQVSKLLDNHDTAVPLQHVLTSPILRAMFKCYLGTNYEHKRISAYKQRVTNWYERRINGSTNDAELSPFPDIAIRKYLRQCYQSYEPIATMSEITKRMKTPVQWLTDYASHELTKANIKLIFRVRMFVIDALMNNEVARRGDDNHTRRALIEYACYMRYREEYMMRPASDDIKATMKREAKTYLIDRTVARGQSKNASRFIVPFALQRSNNLELQLRKHRDRTVRERNNPSLAYRMRDWPIIGQIFEPEIEESDIGKGSSKLPDGSASFLDEDEVEPAFVERAKVSMNDVATQIARIIATEASENAIRERLKALQDVQQQQARHTTVAPLTLESPPDAGSTSQQ